VEAIRHTFVVHVLADGARALVENPASRQRLPVADVREVGTSIAGWLGHELGPDLDELTSREGAVCDLVTRGATNREAAGALHISPRTVEHHLRQVYRKLGVRSRSELTALVARARFSGGAA
jgi:DNA-binding NarL/FixJ family response regulator